jgi:hypothetical protein
MNPWHKKNGIRERDIPGHVRQIAPKFQDGIRAFADSPIIGEVPWITYS